MLLSAVTVRTVSSETVSASRMMLLPTSTVVTYGTARYDTGLPSSNVT